MKTSMKILYDYIVEMEDNYMKMSKKSKDKDFKKGVDAILTATTLIRVQMGDGGFQLEKKQMIDFAMQLHKIDCSKTGTDLLLNEAEQLFNQKYEQNK
jgi:hypothetical protein